MFTYVYDNKGEIPAVEEFTVGSNAVSLGEPLKFDTGKLVNIGAATTKPTFIANAAGAAGAKIPVIRVTPTQHWRTTLNAANTNKPGVKMKLAGSKYDLVGGTGDTSSGIAEIVSNPGQAQYDEIIVCFS